MKSKIIKDHVCRPNNYLLSPFMERIALKISEEAGGNKNNQKRISHGLQILVLREAHRRGIDTKVLYDIIH